MDEINAIHVHNNKENCLKLLKHALGLLKQPFSCLSIFCLPIFPFIYNAHCRFLHTHSHPFVLFIDKAALQQLNIARILAAWQAIDSMCGQGGNR